MWNCISPLCDSARRLWKGIPHWSILVSNAFLTSHYHNLPEYSTLSLISIFVEKKFTINLYLKIKSYIHSAISKYNIQNRIKLRFLLYAPKSSILPLGIIHQEHELVWVNTVLSHRYIIPKGSIKLFEDLFQFSVSNSV